jgi:DNA-binding beta-propeller fold protein YncE
LIEPVGIATSDDGRVYVADSGNGRISVFDTNGGPLGQWIVDSWVGAQFFEPYLAVDAEGLIYASSPNTSSILVYAPDGTLVDEIVDVNEVPLQQPAGMSISGEGELLIADRGSSEIYLLNLAPVVDDGEIDEGEVITDLPGEASPAASPEASPQASPQASPIAG